MMIRLQGTEIAFADGIFTAKANDKNELQYSANFIFERDSDAHKLVEKAIDEAGEKAFGKEWGAVKKRKLKENKLIIKDGDDKAKYEGFEGKLYIQPYSKVRPQVRDRDRTVLVKEDEKIYSGCIVDTFVDISAYTHAQYGPIVSCKLLGVQFRADGGVRKSSRAQLSDSDFTAITEGADAEDL